MPLKEFFQDQITELRRFMEILGETLRVVQCDPDIKQLLLKIFARLDEDEKNPHIMVATQVPFHTEEQFFSTVIKELAESNEEVRADLAEVGVELPPAPADDGTTPWRERFVRYVYGVTKNLPDSIGAYVVIIDPEEITNAAGFHAAMTYLANHTPSLWAKYIVVDQRQAPLLADIEEQSLLAAIQVFYLAPEQMEQQVRDDLQGGWLSPVERRQYMALLGAFASAHGNDDEALQTQQEVVRLAQAEGSRAEQATAYYNLGNSHLKQEEFEQAEACFTQAAEICLDADINPLLAMVLTNLGITLHCRDHLDEALECLSVARRTYAAMNNKPGEAQALDCQADILAKAERPDEAEQAWRDALAMYDGITSKALTDVRDAGRTDILSKLERLHGATEQTDQLQETEA